MSLPELINITEALKLKPVQFFDLRTPSEYAEDHIPDAVNLPLYDDEERAYIGKLYVQQSLQTAWLEGLRIASKRIYQLCWQILSWQPMLKSKQSISFETFSKKKRALKLRKVLYCARGGWRSTGPTQFLRQVDPSIQRLEGGYKSYRNLVCKAFEKDTFQETTAFIANLSNSKIDLKKVFQGVNHLIVLYGYTGSNKTKLLKEIQNDGYAVIDLETYANHRGSAFGSIGLTAQPSQKAFETAIFWYLKNHLSSYFLIEGESRKIGKVSLPRPLWQAMRRETAELKTHYIWLETSLAQRTKNILTEYLPANITNHEAAEENLQTELKQALNIVKPFIPAQIWQKIYKDLDENLYEPAVQKLLVSYYDKYYQKSSPNLKEMDLIIEAEDLSTAKYKICQYIDSLD